MKELFYYAFTILIICSCQNTKSKSESVTTKEKIKIISNIKTTEYQTKSGKKFVVEIDHSFGESICDIKIETFGFSKRNTVYTFEETDPVKNVLITDLDKNGFEEIYIITTSAGSGSYSTIYGIASNKDKSATPIYVYETIETQLQKGELFEGYRGHNLFTLENGSLVNTFPTYNENDVNSNPSGENRKIIYSLITGEAGWILKPDKIIQ